MQGDSDNALPVFLYGTFDWLLNGVFVENEQQHKEHLLSTGALHDKNPWIVMAAVLERAKSGDHDSATRLEQFFFRTQPFALNRTALLLAGMTLKTNDSGLLEKALLCDQAATRCWAAQAAREMGIPTLIAPMLKAWELADSAFERNAISQPICDLLEIDGGELSEESQRYKPSLKGAEKIRDPRIQKFIEKQTNDDRLEGVFPELVQSTAAEAVQEVNAGKALWAGAARHPASIAKSIKQSLTRTIRASDIIHLRRLFEATTGIDCTGFFNGLELDRIKIQSVLEHYEFNHGKIYTPGVRYFFGHPIESKGL